MADRQISKLAERLMMVLANHHATYREGCAALSMALVLSMMNSDTTREAALQAFAKTWDILQHYSVDDDDDDDDEGTVGHA